MPGLAGLAIFLATFATSGAVTYVIKASDPDSVVSLRRMFGLALASNLLWTILLAAGSLSYWITHSPQPSLNEFILGAFFAWSFQLLVVNGAFISSTPQSACIAALQPAVTLLLASIFVIQVNTALTISVTLGFVVLGITAGFLLKFKTFKTEGVGINSLQIFQSFLKSWVSQKPANLENYFTLYSRDEAVVTRIILASAAEPVALVLPGVHPGPFFPVGSYNLSELIYEELRKKDIIPMVLHGVGGHERNLPTNELTKQYAATIASAVASSDGVQRVSKMRGPIKSKLGPTNVTTLGFDNQIMAFLSNAPYNSDDLDPRIIDGAVSAARELGVELMLVDAHNSIGGRDAEEANITDADWKRVFSDIRESPEEEFNVGVAHSSELQFVGGSDISDGGITVLVFRKDASEYALVTSDSNNAVTGLRQAVLDELKRENIDLIELCTSDTHKSAARYLTDRGYRALGEDSSRDGIVATIKKLDELAEGRLSPCKVASITSRLTLPLIGDQSLNDFASLTKETLSFTKAYAGAALLAALIICSLTLFF